MHALLSQTKVLIMKKKMISKFFHMGFFQSSAFQLFLCRNPSASYLHQTCVVSQPQRPFQGLSGDFFHSPKIFFLSFRGIFQLQKEDCPNKMLKDLFLHLIFTVVVISCIYNTLESGKKKPR